jgi:adenosylcobinamide kinase/adenosylcobinamide-phosphate guanylyltransferase
MKALFIGGIKSGKSKNAEEYALSISSQKPYYLATTEFFDEEMKIKVAKHKEQRLENFETIEEGLNLTQALTSLKPNSTVLVECISMWINNMLYHKKSHQQMIEEIESLNALELNLVFVINDVGQSVVSENRLTREFVELSGTLSQLLASSCDKVFQVTAGIRVQLK